ncbi:MAG: PAS domain S-box protein [Candidatus Lambdaproteobacteria bacterium]|nr:PAS domain S-box protein [Candidatus Lambdaproteobacteria bacterium]
MRQAAHAGAPVADQDRQGQARNRRRNDDKFLLLEDGSAQGILVYRHGKPLYANRMFARMFGFQQVDEVLRLNEIRGLVSPDRLGDRLHHQETVQPESGALYRYVLRTRKQDGSNLCIEVLSRIVRWEGERAIQATVVDVTDRVQLEEKLRLSHKLQLVGQMASGLAHEFSNVQQITSGYISLAKEHRADLAQLTEYLNKIEENSLRCTDLIRRLLAIGGGHEFRSAQNGNVNRSITDVLDVIRPIFGKKFELVFNPGAQLGSVTADATCIEQMLINLCLNSRDAMPNGGRIEVRTKNGTLDEQACNGLSKGHAGEFVEIDVADNGVGMSPEVMQRVFEPFFSTKGFKQGSGLGMVLVRDMVQQHHGFMHLESSPGAGTVVKLFLPAGA